MSTFFFGCQTAEEVKSQYHKLARQFHPDMGGDLKTMQAINSEYAELNARFYRAENPEASRADADDAAGVAESIRAAIEAVIGCEGLEIEVCGLWVWVGGNTRANKDTIKAAGYRWAPKKERWYFAGVPSGRSRGMDMDEIRQRHGSVKVAGRTPYSVSTR